MTTGRMPPKCPSCGENNEGDMQFCIFCGSSLIREPSKLEELHHSQQPGPHQSSIITVPSFPSASALVCTVCHRTDPLHGQYCVFCGGRTASTGGTDSSQLNSRSHLMTDRPPMTSSGEFPYAHVVHQSRQSPAGSSKMGTILVTMLAAVLGSALGFGSLFLLKGMVEPKIQERLRTGDGLLLYTSLPGSSVMLENYDEKSLYAGITGKNGGLTIDSILPGSYRISVTDSGGHVVRKNTAVASGQLTTLGYPDPLK